MKQLKFFVLSLVILSSILIFGACGYSSSSSSTTPRTTTPPSSSTSTTKYTLMNKMNALEFAVSAADYEDAATKISEYTLTTTQISEASYIKQIASRNKGYLVLGLLSGNVHMMAWTDGNYGSEFYFRPNN